MAMPSCLTMDDETFERHVQTTAHLLAMRHYQQATPRATRSAAWAFAAANWASWVDRAVEFLAAVEAEREARAAAHTN